VRKRKKPKKKKPQDLPFLSSDEEVLLNTLLENLKTIDHTHIKEHISSHQLAQAFVERLPADDPDTVNLLLAIREGFDQKNIQKAIKKAIFRLKQRGISIPDREPHEDSPPLIRQTEKDEPTAYLGPIDRSGSRGIFIVLPQIPKGVDLGMGVVNDEKGIIQFVYGRYSKKRMRELKDFFFENIGDMIETSLAHAATILEGTYSQNEQVIKDSSSDYLQLRPWILENISLLDQSVIYDFIPIESLSEKILTESQINKLFEHKLMETWIIDPEEMKPLLEKVSEAKESRILVSEVQKLERINEVKDESVAEIFPYSKRSIIRYRLEEMAYVFFKLGEEDYAHLTLAAAHSFEEKDSLLKVNPILKFMVERSLGFYTELAEGAGEPKEHEEDSPSMIIKP
jgi:hypothetical protein